MRLTAKWLVAALVGAALPLPAPVVAQGNDDENPQELGRFYLRLTGGQREIARMSACLENQKPSLARQLFEFQPGSPEYEVVREEFYENAGHCLFNPFFVRGTEIMFLGGLAERLIDEDKPARPVRVEPTSTFAGGGTYQWEWRNLTPAAADRSLPLSECLLARHGGAVQAVLDTRPTSNGERQAYNAMRAEIADCIPLGERLTLQPQILRSALAMTYYRAARATARTVASQEAAE